ncbi:CENPB DNA-binding domain-containing protein 1 [Trichinella papuae]|uniref:CENPB DNA-binding domain-containing protein 1 n=1 Tax=Trichinella papuae TaxID=268474 RepID=A0A0V1MT66_9BILA|nr:CENPB DNA-binding domain-containing protein 1 [Trichinella papuae]
MQRKIISLDIKLQILCRLETGERKVSVGASLNLATSMIIKSSASTASYLSTTKVTRSKTHLFEETERRLSIWVDDQTQRCMPLSQMLIVEKAKSISNHTTNSDIKAAQEFPEQNVQELLELLSESHSNEENSAVRTLTTEFLNNSIIKSAEIMDRFVEHNPDYKRRPKKPRLEKTKAGPSSQP